MSHISEFLPHEFLGFDHIGYHAGNWSFVANRAGQHDVHAVPDTGMHDAARYDLILDRVQDAGRLSKNVDGPHVVFMATGGKSPFRADAQRRAKQGALDIVGRESISREKTIDIA